MRLKSVVAQVLPDLELILTREVPGTYRHKILQEANDRLKEASK